VLSVVGMMVMVSANDLIVLYMGLELQSLAIYVIAAIRRDSAKSTEAGLKYFILGALVVGAAALRRLADLRLYRDHDLRGHRGRRRAPGPISLGLLFGLVFLITGLAFKVSAVPFHMWTPDVYEGSPTPVTAFFATAPKVAAIGALSRGSALRRLRRRRCRLAADRRLPVGRLDVPRRRVAAIGQRNIKRLMAYSSIAHMGFALMGLAAGTRWGRRRC
jgi:NADH-quinone oxidoreductase subunit N